MNPFRRDAVKMMKRELGCRHLGPLKKVPIIEC